jgi:hypothetical protein
VLRIVVLGLVMAAVLAPSAQAATAPNVRGMLVIPRSAVCPPDEPCDPPPAAGAVVFSRSGRVAGQVRIGAAGAFALRLAPGKYTIRLAARAFGPQLSPATVQVPRTGRVWLKLSVVA